ncbi:MAG: hypothetical protein JO102_04410, partial [Elusimicrobia bacterium]|nr:hypothetical protein [Elusimicrobiota bacterium]
VRAADSTWTPATATTAPGGETSVVFHVGDGGLAPLASFQIAPAAAPATPASSPTEAGATVNFSVPANIRPYNSRAAAQLTPRQPSSPVSADGKAPGAAGSTDAGAKAPAAGADAKTAGEKESGPTAQPAGTSLQRLATDATVVIAAARVLAPSAAPGDVAAVWTAAESVVSRAAAGNIAPSVQAVPAASAGNFAMAQNGDVRVVFVRTAPNNWVSITDTNGNRVVERDLQDSAVDNAPNVQRFSIPTESRSSWSVTQIAASILGAIGSGVSAVLSNKVAVGVVAAGAVLLGDPARAAGAVLDAAPIPGGSSLVVPVVLGLSALTVVAFQNLPSMVRFGREFLQSFAQGREARRQPYTDPVTGPTLAMAMGDGSTQSFHYADMNSFASLAPDANTRTESAALAALYPGNIIGPAVRLRGVTLANSPSRSTVPIIAAASALGELAGAKAPVWGGRNDLGVSAQIIRLAGSSLVGSTIRNINVGALLEQTFPAGDERLGDIDYLFPGGRQNLTLGNVIDGVGLNKDAKPTDVAAFRAFVYQLVAHNGESIRGQSFTAIPDSSIERFSRLSGNNPVIMVHTHLGQQARPELGTGDALTLASASDNPLVASLGIISGRNGLLMFNQAAGLSIDMLHRGPDIKPVAAPYQITQVNGVLGAETESGLMRALRGDRRQQPEQEITVGRTMLKLVEALYEPGVAQATREMVWEGLALAAADPEFNLESFLTMRGAPSTSIAALMRELTVQMRSLPGVMNLAAAGHLPAIGVTVKSFLDVSALPEDREWLLGRLGETFDMPLMDHDGAAKLVAQLRERMAAQEKSGYGKRLFAQLSSLSGADRADFFPTVNRWMQALGVATDSGSVRAVLNGKPGADKDPAAMAVALGTEIEPIVIAMAQAAGIKIDANLREQIDNLRVELPEQLDPLLSHGKAGLT